MKRKALYTPCRNFNKGFTVLIDGYYSNKLLMILLFKRLHNRDKYECSRDKNRQYKRSVNARAGSNDNETECCPKECQQNTLRIIKWLSHRGR